MPSTTRGSILISTANDIGEALVEKLGGVGYSPNEWKDKFNLCGIAPVDSAPALSVLSNSAGTGDERGSILIATADAIGAILNKKYNVLRGFKPKEWASACRKMKALEEGSVASASIASFPDGADAVPLKSWLVTLPASLSGYSEVNGTKNTGTDTPETQYTASLGRTIYGGTADVVKGEGQETHARIKISDLNWTYYTGGTNPIFYAINVPNMKIYERGEMPSIVIDGYVTRTAHSRSNLSANMADMECSAIENAQTITFRNDAYTSVSDMLAVLGDDYIVYELATPTDFTFTPITPTPETALGTNNFWADEGDSAVEYYKAPTPYTRKTVSGGIANFSDQRTDLPLTKAIANIAPSIAGKSTVNLYQQRKNLIDISNSAEITRNQLNSNVAPIFNTFLQGKTGGYTISGKTVQTVSDDANFISIRINYTDGTQSENVLIYRGDGHSSGGISGDFYIASNTAKTIDSIVFGGNTGTAKCGFENWQLEVGSTASAYVPYSAPTTYTAELGETVYGGSVDFVSGEVKQVVKKKTVSSFSGTYGAVNNGYAYYITDAGTTHNVSAVNPAMMIANQLFAYGSSFRGNAPAWQYGGNDGGDQTHTFILPSEYDTLTKANNFLANLETPLEVTLTLTTPTESAIPGRVISPIEGVNNYWNDAGGDTEIEYFEDET